MSMSFFPYLSAVIYFCASFVFALNAEWRLALLWFLYACANVVLGGIR